MFYGIFVWKHKKFACDANFLEDFMEKAMEMQIDKKRERYRKRYGAVIRCKRRKQNISQKELADKLGVTGTTVSRYETGALEIPASSLPLISEICKFKFSEYMEAFDIYLVSNRMAEIESYGYVSSKAAYPPPEWDVARCKRERLRLIAKIKEKLKDASDNDELFCMIRMFDVMQGYDEETMPGEWRMMKKDVVKRARTLMRDIPKLYNMVPRYDILTRVIEKKNNE